MERGPLHLGRQEFGHPDNRGRLPTRPEAHALLNDWVDNERLKLHMRQVAALTEAWARERLGLPSPQVDLWYVAGLLHDADWDRWPETHPQRIIAHLEDSRHDPDLLRAIAAHGPRHFGVMPESELEKMLFAFDELSGFVHAVSLVRPEGYAGMEASSVKKKLKQASFAAQVDRQDIADGVELAGVPFDELCTFVIRVQSQVK